MIPGKLAYSLEEAALACGYGQTTLKVAIRRGELVARFANAKPVIPVAELESWLESLPTERPPARLAKSSG